VYSVAIARTGERGGEEKEGVKRKTVKGRKMKSVATAGWNARTGRMIFISILNEMVRDERAGRRERALNSQEGDRIGRLAFRSCGQTPLHKPLRFEKESTTIVRMYYYLWSSLRINETKHCGRLG
jgi:hypothetical protein